MAIELFQKFLNKNNLNITILESENKTHTAQQAADAHSVPIQNIVKSILVKIDTQFCLFLVPGDKKIDLVEKKKFFNAKQIEIAKPEEVKNITGYSIGGVPPFGHKTKITVYIEKGFDKSQELLAAAGSPNAVFKISLETLQEITSTS